MFKKAILKKVVGFLSVLVLSLTMLSVTAFANTSVVQNQKPNEGQAVAAPFCLLPIEVIIIVT